MGFPDRRNLFLATTILLLALLGAAGWWLLRVQPPQIRVGSKAFTESVILGDMLRLLAIHEGATASHLASLGDTSKTWNGLLTGQLDVYVEYTGTLLYEIYSRERLRTLPALDAALARDGLGMSRPLGFRNNYALALREKDAQNLGITSISDLRKHPELRIGLSQAFIDRADGWHALKRHYGLPFVTPAGMEHALAYKGLGESSLDVVDVYTTDAEIRRLKLRVLVDDRNFFPAYEAVLIYRLDLEKRQPGVLQALRRLEGQIDEATMQELNSRTNIDRVPPLVVAGDFLTEHFQLRVEYERDTLFSRLLRATRAHLTLVLLSLGAAILTSVPLGIVAARKPVVGQVILVLISVVQTFPALALLSVLIVLLHRIGMVPAVLALYLYSLLPIVRNTYLGLTDIPLSVRESADALGLAPLAQLWLIELPMASRAILAGIKTAAVINVGFATLGGLVGAGGYGESIMSGLNRNDSYLVLEGAIPAMLMALVAQGLFEVLDRILVPRGLRLQPAR